MKPENEQSSYDPPSSSSPTSALYDASVLNFWVKFDLDSKRVTLDSQGLEMQGSKEASMRSRKKLAEETKVFRKLSDTEKLEKIGNLLKSYQEEIDKLTRRAKFSEGCFLTFYKSLYTAPDPVAALESVSALASRALDLDEQNKKMAVELKEYEEEFAGLKNQDITIRNLESKIAQLHSDVESMVEQEVVKRSMEINAEAQLQIDAIAQQEQTLKRIVEQTEIALLESQKKVESMQSELTALRRKNEDGCAAHDTEFELLAQEKQLKTTLQFENAELKRKLAQLHEELSFRDAQSYSTSKSEIIEKEEKIADLEAQLATYKRELAEATSELEDTNRRHEVEGDELRQEISKRPTIEYVKGLEDKLRLFEQLEYNVIDVDDGDVSQRMGSVEKLLIKKVRKLQGELQQNSITIEQMQASFDEVQEELERKNDAIREQAALIHRLENDIACGDSATQKKSATSNTQILSQVLSTQTSAVSHPADSVVESSGMMEIIRGQRDRFRERIKELENEKEKQMQQLNNCKILMQRLEADNIQLFETIRYLRSYKGGKVSRTNLNVNQLMEEGATHGVVENKYKQLYEEKMNPFTQFNHSEQQKRYSNLSAAEKITLMSTQMFLSNKFMRNFAFFYIMMLHVLVMATLYSYTTFQCNN